MVPVPSHAKNWRQELRPMLHLAAPLALSELGWMAMGIVDTMFVGRLSAEAIGAISVGTTVFHTLAICAGGLLLGLDTLVAQAAGAKDRTDSRRSLVNGLWLAALLIPIIMVAVRLITPALSGFGVNPDVVNDAVPYISALNWSTAPLLLFFALRRYLQSYGAARPIMWTLLGANLVNVAGNWLFVFGNLGAPRLGVAGSAWATFWSRVFMLAALAAVAWYRERDLTSIDWRPDLHRLREILRLGLPAAGQMALEFTVWTAATVLAGRFATEVLAGHQIALMVVSTTFMMPLGISAAAAVRVGQALGRGDPRGAAHSGWTAVGLGTVVMSCTSVVFLFFPAFVARLFTPDAAVIAAASPILRVTAFFQLFDGFQVVVTGALRGAGDTRTPMLCHFGGYWLLGFPFGIWLAFGLSMSALGLWMGLSLGVITIGTALLVFWRRAAHGFEQRHRGQQPPVFYH